MLTSSSDDDSWNARTPRSALEDELRERAQRILTTARAGQFRRMKEIWLEAEDELQGEMDALSDGERVTVHPPRAERVLSFIEARIPRRNAAEEVGDALECAAAARKHGASERKIAAMLYRRAFWALINAAVLAFRGWVRRRMT